VPSFFEGFFRDDVANLAGLREQILAFDIVAFARLHGDLCAGTPSAMRNSRSNRLTRAHACSPLVESGRVLLPGAAAACGDAYRRSCAKRFGPRRFCQSQLRKVYSG